MPEKSLLYIIKNWNVYDSIKNCYKSEVFTKQYELSLNEVDTIDTFIAKRNSFLEVFPDLLVEEVNCNHLVIDDTRIYTSTNYNLEQKITEMLFAGLTNHSLAKYQIKTPTKEQIMSAITKIEKEEGHELGDLQIKAVATSLVKNISLITGGPGRGKTTIIKTIIEGWRSCGNDVSKCILLAPTGRAAQRMTESIGQPDILRAQTIHRLILQVNSLSGCLIIVDEMSMVDMPLFYELLSLGAVQNKFVLVGDHNQLPSVGHGKILKDIFDSNVIPFTFLSKCYRSSGSIAQNADKINDGFAFKDLVFDAQYNFHCINKENKDTTLSKIIEIYKELLKRYPTKDVCILSCRRKDCDTSANNINRHLQELINPVTNPDNELKIYMYGDTQSFRVNDRVMHIKNNYSIPTTIYDEVSKEKIESLGCFNGETGTIIGVDSLSKKVNVRFDDGKECLYSIENLDELTLAYAITVHKSQGSEYPAIIHVENTNDFMMLSRKIFYTASSRGKNEVHLIGDPSCFNMAIKNTYVAERNTYLSNRLKNKFAEVAKN